MNKNTFKDYVTGHCTALEYMKAEYITRNADPRWQRGDITEVTRKGDLYYIFTVPNDFKNKKVDGTDYIIRDMRNGVRVNIEDVFYPFEGEEFFNHCYDTMTEFKEYVDTKGKCLEI